MVYFCNGCSSLVISIVHKLLVSLECLILCKLYLQVYQVKCSLKSSPSGRVAELCHTSREQGDCLVIRAGTAHVQVRELREVQLPFASGVAIPVRLFLPSLAGRDWAEGFVALEGAWQCQPVPPATLQLRSIRVCDLALDWIFVWALTVPSRCSVLYVATCDLFYWWHMSGGLKFCISELEAKAVLYCHFIQRGVWSWLLKIIEKGERCKDSLNSYPPIFILLAAEI